MIIVLMTERVDFENSSDIGCFAKVTNTYALVATGACENFYSAFEKRLGHHIPVIHGSVANTVLVGRLCAANSKGILVPMGTTDAELQHIRDCLPDEVRVR